MRYFYFCRDLQGHTLGARFVEKNDMTGSYFYKANLSESEFEDTCLDKSTFKNCDLENCKIGRLIYVENANFFNCNMRGVRFSELFLTGANFNNVDITSGDFHESKITSTTWTESNLSHAYFKKINAGRAKFSKIEGCFLNGREGYFKLSEFTESNLAGADFQNANVSFVKFDDSTLVGACFKDADLEGASFKNCDIRGVDFTDADLTGVDFTGAVFDETTILENAKIERTIGSKELELLESSIYSEEESSTYSEEIPDGIPIDEEHFPDEKFRDFVNEKYGTDGMLTDDTIAETTWIACSNCDIKDLTGIEYFTALKSLDCHHNNITTLDMSNNAALKDLFCNENALTTINISKNTALENIECGNNPLTTLDISHNMALENFGVPKNLSTIVMNENKPFNFAGSTQWGSTRIIWDNPQKVSGGRHK